MICFGRNEHMNKCKFDERQLYIRGNIFKHMTIAFVVLLFCDAILKSSGLIWANSWSSNVIMILIATAIGSNEMIFREVYLSRDGVPGPVFIWILGIVSGLRIFCSCTDIAHGYKLVTGKGLTDAGSSLVITLLLSSIVISYILKIFMKKIEKPKD